MKSYGSSAFFILGIYLLVTPASSQPNKSPIRIPKLWSVHIDEVMPSSLREFDRLSAKQSTLRDSLYRTHQLPVTPVYSFRTKRGKYFSFRAKSAYGDLDQASHLPDNVQKVFDSVVSPYSDTVHSLLRHHHNELWAWDSSMSSCAPEMKTSAGAMKFAFLHSEWVKPGMEDVYDSVMSKFAEALRKVDASVCRLTFTSRYGSGAVTSLFFAENDEHLQPIIQRKNLLSEAFGMQEAIALTQSWSACLSGSEESELIIDLPVTNLSPDAPWFGMVGR